MAIKPLIRTRSSSVASASAPQPKLIVGTPPTFRQLQASVK
jgi:hypothetical protein